MFEQFYFGEYNVNKGRAVDLERINRDARTADLYKLPLVDLIQGTLEKLGPGTQLEPSGSAEMVEFVKERLLRLRASGLDTSAKIHVQKFPFSFDEFVTWNIFKYWDFRHTASPEFLYSLMTAYTPAEYWRREIVLFYYIQDSRALVFPGINSASHTPKEWRTPVYTADRDNMECGPEAPLADRSM